MDYEGRTAKLRSDLATLGLDALLVTNLTNVRYLTGFSGTNGQVLVGHSGTWFFSDPRYEARAMDLVRGAEVAIYPARLTDVLTDRLRRAGIRRLAIEATTMSVAQHDDLAAKLDVELVPVRNIVEGLRRSKEADEVAAIREAVRLADETFAWAVDRLAPGTTEREVALDIEVRMRLSGADEVSFNPIVGSGPLSAHIHHTPTERAFEKGDLVLLDFGCRFEGYCSDLTRTVVLGAASEDQRERYESVLAAQRAGIAAATQGAAAADVDRAARQVIDAVGHGDDFTHGLGHGVGLDIHEAPTLKDISEDTLTAGDVVTVEPGIYVIGEGGVRIEDCVLITEDGAEVLGMAPKEHLIEL
ncbi:MAG: Xaa-Pro peptidase family protein [Actinomycetota bacterium]|nr:Xaa-Pro peptidase family protein [Actinomycetota bacterium]